MNVLDKRDLLVANVRGKRVRAFLFYAAAIVALILLAAGVVFSVRHVTAMAVVSYFWAGCALLLAFFLREPLCILAQDRLYFLHGDAIKKHPNSRRTHSELNCRGYVFYSEITAMQHVGGALHYTRHWKNGYLLLIGKDFELKIYDVGRSLIKKIKKRQVHCNAPCPESIPVAQSAPQGNAAWMAFWTACECGALEKKLRELGTVTQLDLNCELGTVDLALLRCGKEVCANIDRDSIYLCIPETPIEQTYPLAGLSPDEIYALLRGFAEQHTYR